jgi:hypothetical protein
MFEVDKSEGKPMAFTLVSDDIGGVWDPQFPAQRSSMPVPVGEWFFVEIFTNFKTYREGNGVIWVKINGRKILEVKPTSQYRICGRTTSSSTCDNPSDWNLIKLYTYDSNIEAWLDDYQIYDEYTPGDTSQQSGSCNNGLTGDVNCDGSVNIIDLVVVSHNWGRQTSIGDADGSGYVDIIDLVLIAKNFGQSV